MKYPWVPPSFPGPSALCAVRGARRAFPPGRFLVVLLDPLRSATPASTRGLPGLAR